MISVCMATHNGEKFLQKQIDSIIKQLDSEDELIISDDGSKDKTLEILESYKDSRIKVLNFKPEDSLKRMKNAKLFYYVTANFYNALKNTKGDYIFLADQDDVWLDKRINMMLEKLYEYDCVMCNLSTIDYDDNVICRNYFTFNPVPSNLLQYVMKTRILGCCLAFNRKVLNYSFPFPNKLIMHDYWLGAISIYKFRFCFINEVLHLYRRTDTNVSTTTNKSKNPFYFKIYYRVIFLYQFIKHIIEKRKVD